jgi:cytochrome P450
MVARQEAELVLEALVSRVKSIKLVGEPVRRLNNTLHAIESLHVEVEPA